MKDKKRIAETMILMYCKGNKHDIDCPCDECRQLVRYMEDKADNCISGKLYCTNCNTPCYNNEMKEKIKTVMRYSGPRMIIYHPILAIQHLLTGLFHPKVHNSNKGR